MLLFGTISKLSILTWYNSPSQQILNLDLASLYDLMSGNVCFLSGLPWIPETMSFRIAFAFWWFSVTSMIAVYTGNLTAVLAVPNSPIPINTLEELAQQSKYKYGVIGSGALKGLFAVRVQNTSSTTNLVRGGQRSLWAPGQKHFMGPHHKTTSICHNI